MFMHWENTHVLAIVEAMLIFWELTCVLSVVHWITWGNERNFRQCGPLSGSLYYNLTTTQQKDMRDLSNTWRHAGKEHDMTLSKHGSHGGPLCDLYPSRGHACPINHLETWGQGAWHSKHGSRGGPLSDLYPSRGHACHINHLETCWPALSVEPCKSSAFSHFGFGEDGMKFSAI